jgi:hypothetical protein
MGITDKPLAIDNAIQRHAAQFEQVHLLFVNSGNAVVRIGQADKGDVFLRPILLKGRRGIGSNRQNLRTASRKFIVLVPQARQLRAAMRSHKPAQESQNNRLAIAETRKAHGFPFDIFQFKVRRLFPGGDEFVHWFNASRNCAVASAICVHCSSAEMAAG